MFPDLFRLRLEPTSTQRVPAFCPKMQGVGSDAPGSGFEPGSLGSRGGGSMHKETNKQASKQTNKHMSEEVNDRE